MRLADDRDPVVGEPLDDVHLPQRAVPVEMPRLKPGDQLEQLLVRTGLG
jgi:hypothetical protein